jgi:hypothetical protein
MPNDRFIIQLQEASSPEETASRCMQEVIRLTSQLNAAKVPVSVGPNENLPEGMLPGQPVIDWSTGVSQLKVWDGKQLI